MGILDIFRKRSEASAGGAVAVRESVPISIENRTALKAISLRPGMWVSTKDGVGILRDLGPSGLMDVMLVDSAGANKLQVLADPRDIRQAKLAEIPASRHHPDLDLMNALGYY